MEHKGKRGVRRFETAMDLAVVGGVLLLAFHLLFRGFFPNRAGHLGHDYSYFLPHLLAGDFWIIRNGFFSIPWFTPAFCGGVPVFANPQSPFATLPQILSAALLDPLAAVYASVLVFAWIGYAGMYLLARGGFGASRPAAVTAAAFFLFNGFYVHRMAVGHLPFHPFMLTPLVAFLLLRERGADDAGHAHHPHYPEDVWSHVRDVVLAALCIAYMVVAGMVQAMVPVLLSIVVLGLWHGARCGRAAVFWGRLAGAGILAALMSAARLAAAAAFVGQFPRTDYTLPGATSIFAAVRLAAESLFVRPAHEAAKATFVQVAWPLDQHEWEYGVTVVPLLLVAAWAVVSAKKRLRTGRDGMVRPSPASIAAGAAAVVILCLPIALNVYTPAWNAFLKQLPLLQSSVTLIRWFCLYIPLLTLATAPAIDALVVAERWRFAAAVAGVAICIGTNVVADDSFYQKQPYDPAPVTAAYRRLEQGIPDIVAIGDMRTAGNDGLVRGQSLPRCYEPIFGYRQEHLDLAALRAGSVFLESGDRLNLKNPACYVFPRDNHCSPGDHFRTSERERAAALAEYRPFEFEQSSLQHVANAASIGSMLAASAFLLACGIRRLRELD